MKDNWTVVYTTGVRHLAELAKQVLVDNNIPAVVFSKKDSSYLFGDIEVYVEKENLDEAKKIIEQFENNINIE